VARSVALLFRATGPNDPTCVRRWSLATGLDDRVLWCDDGLMTANWPSPSGGMVLTVVRYAAPGGKQIAWGSLDAVTGGHVAFELPSNAYPLSSPVSDTSAWEDDTHVIFKVGGSGDSRAGIRCDATTGGCEQALLPADLA
jgi:hypothetical protein